MRRFLVRLTIMASLVAFGLAAQQGPVTAPTANIPNAPVVEPPGSELYGGSQIGIGDILDIRVAEDPTIAGRYQVDQNGNLQMPLLKGAITAAGLSTFQLANKLRDELKEQDILREPSVTVFILRGMSQNVTVLGAVMKPGIYVVEQPTTLLDLISRAGGLQVNAGNQVTIASRADNSGATSQPPELARRVNLPALMSGSEPSANVLTKPGDVVTISTAPVVFVVGAVVKPGAFTVQNSKSEMTVLQAIAMAEGTQPTASLGHALIVRQSSSDSQRTEIPLDLTKVIRGKDSDQVLTANDILFVPQSGFKAGMRRAGDVAVTAAGQVASYGLGLRIGR